MYMYVKKFTNISSCLVHAPCNPGTIPEIFLAKAGQTGRHTIGVIFQSVIYMCLYLLHVS